MKINVEGVLPYVQSRGYPPVIASSFKVPFLVEVEGVLPVPYDIINVERGIPFVDG